MEKMKSSQVSKSGTCFTPIPRLSHIYRILFQKLRKIQNIHSGCFVVVIVKVKLVLSRIELRIVCDMHVLSDMHVSNCANILDGSSRCYEIDTTFHNTTDTVELNSF